MKKKGFICLIILLLVIIGIPQSVLAIDNSNINRANEYALEEEELNTSTPTTAGDRSLNSIYESSNDTNSSYSSSSTSDNLKDSQKSSNNLKNAPSTRNSSWSDGKIYVLIKIAGKDDYRNNWQYPSYGTISWPRASYCGNGEAELLDEDDNVVASFSGNYEYTFENLPEGKYRIRLSMLDTGMYSVVKGVNNSGPMDNLIFEEYSDWIEITEGDTSTKNRYAVVEYKAFGFKTTTDIGLFTNNLDELIYYRGLNYAFHTTDPDYHYVNSHDGIYYGDSAGLYTGMNKLEIPTLNSEENAKGYVFVGWKLAKDSSGKIYTDQEALSYIVNSNVEFEAIWTYPTHKINFLTNINYGTINGKSSYEYERDFNNQRVTEIPTVTAKEGYEFIGWYTDLTTNVVPTSDIKNTIIDRDLNFYAKFKKKDKKYTVKYLKGSNGNLKGTEKLSISSNKFIPTIPTVIPNSTYKHTGLWKITKVGSNTIGMKTGDVLNEIQISRLQVNYDLELEALYDKKTSDSDDIITPNEKIFTIIDLLGNRRLNNNVTNDSGNPNTSDTINIYIALAILSITGIITGLYFRKNLIKKIVD